MDLTRVKDIAGQLKFKEFDTPKVLGEAVQDGYLEEWNYHDGPIRHDDISAFPVI